METRPKRGPTLAQANLLLLISLVLILVIGALTPALHFYWTLLIREVLLILGPALLFLVLLGLPWKETLRWRVPDWRVLGASALIGLGGWLFDTWLGTLIGEFLGYTLPLPPDFYPTTVAQALVLFGLLAIAAPICEEVLFRGLIQRGYEQIGIGESILLTGLLFALFHQSLIQGLALVPLAILLSWLAWRTNSLPAVILAHAVNNAPGALLIPLSTLLPELSAISESGATTELSADLAAGLTAINPAICMLPAALLGGLLVLGGLWAIRRWCPPPPAVQRAPLQPGLGRWLGRTWPLLLIVPLTLFVIGTEVVMGAFPGILAFGKSVPLDAPWTGPQTWCYEVRNVRDETVGTIECTLAPDAAEHTLTCRHRRSAYEADTGHGVYYGGDLDESTIARWQDDNLRLFGVDRTRELEFGWRSFSAARFEDAIGVTMIEQDGSRRPFRLPIPGFGFEPLPTTVIEHSEWPWRLSALPFQSFYSAKAALLDPEPSEGDRPTLTSISVVIYGSEPIVTPADSYVAWRVEVGDDHVAWYDTEAPHPLVAWEDGMERWVLTSVE
jgi:membrane protease YdiL (CAAX protease family)